MWLCSLFEVSWLTVCPVNIVRTCLSVDVLVGDASQVWKKEKASMAKCVCTEKKGCDEDCLNRCTWMECDEGNCNVEPQYCSNRAFADLKERVKTGTKFAEGVEVILVVPTFSFRFPIFLPFTSGVTRFFSPWEYVTDERKRIPRVDCKLWAWSPSHQEFCAETDCRGVHRRDNHAGGE